MRLFLCLCLSWLVTAQDAFAQPGQKPMDYNPEVSERWQAIQNYRSFHKKQMKDAAIAAEVPLNLPFIDDFSGNYVFADSTKWVKNSGVYVGDRFASEALSKGVATFDGIQVNGQPYSTNLLANGPCDTLTSFPFLLSGLEPDQKASLYLSFYLQASHLRITQLRPDTVDSLVVQLYNPRQETWRTARVFRGGSVDSGFRFYAIKVADSLAVDGFRFRFLNYGRQNGTFDIWNLDYVYFDAFRTDTDSLYADVSMVGPLQGYFRRYRAIPVDHYNRLRQTAVNDTLLAGIQNVGGALVVYTHRFLADSTLTTGRYNAGAFLNSPLPSPLLGPRGDALERIKSTVFADRLVTLRQGREFPTVTSFRYNYALDGNAGGFNSIRSNDTLSSIATLQDYYQADDGTAELVHYVSGNSAGFVTKFFPLDTGKLTGISLFLDQQTFSVNSTITARIYVYRKLQGVDGALSDNIAYGTTVTLQPNSGIPYQFKFATPVSMGLEPYYIGYRQDLNDDNRLFIRSDINSGQAEIFTNFAGNWERATTLRGQPMMRAYYQCSKCPVAVKPKQKMVALEVAPNPVLAGSIVRVKGIYTSLDLFSVDGKKIVLDARTEGTNTYFTLPATQQPGIYMVVARTAKGGLAHTRLTVQ